MKKVELTNMVMIEDKNSNKVVVIDRINKYPGIAFPGGHIEDNESIYDSAVREVKEETGLDIWNLKSCGFIHWYNNKNGDRYFTYFYKTSNFSGKLLSETEEGKVFWINFFDISPEKFAPNMNNYMKMFNNNGYSEAFCSWNENDSRNIIFK